METFTLSRKELHRPGLLKAACAGRVTNAQVAAALGISVRHVRRLKRRWELGGAPALAHRSRGRPSPRRLPAAVREAVIRLLTTTYRGFNDTHLTEKLRERHGLTLSRESVRRLRRQLGQPPQRPRRAPRARRRRVPEAARGARSMTPPRRSWPCSSGPPRTSMAMRHSFAPCSPPMGSPWPSTAIA